MNRKLKKFGRKQSSGATLIEAVAGLAILGSLLVSLIVAGANFRRQNQAANKIETACKLLDEFLLMNENSLSLLAENQEGSLAKKGWRWESEILPAPATDILKARKLKIYAIGPDSDSPDASVEILIDDTK